MEVHPEDLEAGVLGKVAAAALRVRLLDSGVGVVLPPRPGGAGASTSTSKPTSRAHTRHTRRSTSFFLLSLEALRRLVLSAPHSRDVTDIKSPVHRRNTKLTLLEEKEATEEQQETKEQEEKKEQKEQEEHEGEDEQEGEDNMGQG